MGRSKLLLVGAVACLLSTMGVVTAPPASANMDNPDNVSTLQQPSLFIVYWGNEWANGFSTNGFSSQQYQAYLENYITMITSRFDQSLSSITQYGAHAPTGIAGRWTDTGDEPPALATDFDFADEVVRAQDHFNDVFNGNEVSPNSLYFVALPSGRIIDDWAGSGGNTCAYHEMTFPEFAPLGQVPKHTIAPYIAFPYQPDAANCSRDFNTTDSFGHGFFDGVSKVAGHEIGEALTDPFIDGWRDRSVDAGENGDLCNTEHTNVSDTFDYYAIQSLWSNAKNGCDFGDQGALSLPPSVDFGEQTRGKTSSPRSIEVMNGGTADVDTHALTWTLSDPSAGFAFEPSDTCGAVLHPHQTCSKQLSFTPHDTGPHQTTLTARAGALSASMSITGDGQSQFAQILAINPTTVTASDVFNFTTFHAHIVNLTTDVQEIHAVGFSGENAVEYGVLVNHCPPALNPGQGCDLDLSFNPEQRGMRYAKLDVSTVAFSDSGEFFPVFSAAVPGRGLGSAYTTIGSATDGSVVNFPTAEGLSNHVHQSVRLMSDGERPVQLSSISSSGDFSQTNNCGSFIAVGDSCTIDVVNVPTAGASQRGTLDIMSDAWTSLRSIGLSGAVEGPWASLSKGVVDFGEIPANVLASATVHLVAREADEFDVTSIAVADSLGNAPTLAQSNDCPTVLGGACAITIRIHPTQLGGFAGVLNVSTTARNGTLTLPIRGTVVAEPTAVAAGALISVLGSQPVSVFNLTATLTGPNRIPIPNRAIDFSAGGTPICTAQTDGNGLASCSVLTNLTALASIAVAQGYDARFAGTPTMLSSQGHGDLVHVGA